MQCEIRSLGDVKTKISDTLPKRGLVNEVCKEWIVHEDEALAYKLQKQEVDQHYGGNKERNARVREDFPRAKEEQEKEIEEAAIRYQQMVRQQEEIDSTYARRVADRLEKEDIDRRVKNEMHDTEIAKKMQMYEVARNMPSSSGKVERCNFIRDANIVGLPVSDETDQHGVPHYSVAVTRNLRKLRLVDDVITPSQDFNRNRSRNSIDMPSTSGGVYAERIPTPALLLPDEVNAIITDEELQEEANRRLQEEKDAELAKILQRQEQQIISEEEHRDRMLAIEAQDKELAKLLYEKEKAKLRRAKERARQRALLKKQQESANIESQNDVNGNGIDTSMNTESQTQESEHHYDHIRTYGEQDEYDVNGNQEPLNAQEYNAYRQNVVGSPMSNVAIHIDPTYLSHQSASMPNSLTFHDDHIAPPYMPIQGQRRLPEDKKQKKKSKDSCKQQ